MGLDIIGLDVIDGVATLDMERDVLPHQRLDEDLGMSRQLRLAIKQSI